MKVKIILAIAWMSLCACERHQRSTVLTDESKRIIDHFDFSNFDKQEALNYLDRQRYDNQIRGKRSHPKHKRDHKDKNEWISDKDLMPKQLLKGNEDNESQKCSLNNHDFKNDDERKTADMLNFLGFLECDSGYPWLTSGYQTHGITKMIRNKRGHRSKKKHGCKSHRDDDDTENEENRHRKRKKKKKRKRRYWDHWTEWSPCSVTCGRGRKIRWRKCIVKNCTTGELEMGEKTCQLPACNLLTKLLGL